MLRIYYSLMEAVKLLCTSILRNANICKLMQNRMNNKMPNGFYEYTEAIDFWSTFCTEFTPPYKFMRFFKTHFHSQSMEIGVRIDFDPWKKCLNVNDFYQKIQLFKRNYRAPNKENNLRNEIAFHDIKN